MVLVRGARPSDLDRLAQAARHLDSYNLPADHRALAALIRDSCASFAGRLAPQRRRYLFVAEEGARGSVVGCSLILARHGTPKLPHLSFQVDSEEKRSRTLGRRVRNMTLKLTVDSRGFTEVGGLVLLPAYRGHSEHIGRLLSYARFVYMAAHRADFLPRLLVEYQADLDALSGSKLWQYVGQHFTGLTYREADRLSAVNKEFILSLFPREKLYTSVLPYSAQRTIGAISPGARASRKLLEKQSFRYCGQVDPFDGGPHYTAGWDEVPLLRACRSARLLDPREFRGGTLKNYIVMAGASGRPRIVRSQGMLTSGGFCLSPDAIARLGVSRGAVVHIAEDER